MSFDSNMFLKKPVSQTKKNKQYHKCSFENVKGCYNTHTGCIESSGILYKKPTDFVEAIKTINFFSNISDLDNLFSYDTGALGTGT